MEVKTCSRCNRTKDINMFEGFKQCLLCRESRRASHKNWYGKYKETINEKRREERANNSTYCELCDRRVKHENWDEHFFWVQHSGSELNLLLKNYEKHCISSKKSIEDKEEAKKEYYRKKKRYTRNFANNFQIAINGKPK